MNRIILLLSLVLLLPGCNSQSTTSQHVDLFIRLYEERTDFQDFLDLYAEDVVLEDMVTGYRLEGRDAFAEFFNWPDKRFEKLSEKTFIIQNKVVEDNKAVISGYFTAFKWDGQSVEPMQFTTWLYYNEAGKIIKHIDWINYPNSLIDYAKRGNSNLWISP